MQNFSRRIWQHDEVMALLRACLTHKTNYNDIRHRSNTLKFILSDLKSRGVLTSECTLASMRLKLKYLRKCWKDTKTSGSQPYGFFALYKDMCDELFGTEYAWKRCKVIGNIPVQFLNGNNQILRTTTNTLTTTTTEPKSDEKASKSKGIETDENIAEISKKATQKYFKAKMDDIIAILNKRDDILQNYLKEKMKLKIKALLAKQRRQRERAKVIQEILENKEKWGRLNLQDVESMLF